MNPDATRTQARAPRGFSDRRPSDLAAERKITDRITRLYSKWGFEQLDTPSFEYVDALGKFLPDTDRPNEGVFALLDDDDQWIALRYDLTAPLARFAAQNWETLPKPYKRFAVGKVWRNEKPGPGRYREFVQCDADIVGSDRPEADAEILSLAARGLRSLGLGSSQAKLKISHRRLLDGLLDETGVIDRRQRLVALRAVDKLDRLGFSGVAQLLSEGRIDESGDFTAGAELPFPAIYEIERFLSAAQRSRGTQWRMLHMIADCRIGSRGHEAVRELENILVCMKAYGAQTRSVTIDPTVVRGLEYYTGAVFEAELCAQTVDEHGHPVRFGSIGGGGRYDDLVARFTGNSLPSTGFSFGVSRLASALRAAGRIYHKPTRGPVVVIVFSEADMQHYLEAVAELRGAGIAAELYLGRAGMKAQMKYADRRGAPAAVILGGDEIAAGQVTVKDLDAGRALAAGIADNEAWKAERPGQVVVPRADLVATVRGIVDAPHTDA